MTTIKDLYTEVLQYYADNVRLSFVYMEDLPNIIITSLFSTSPVCDFVNVVVNIQTTTGGSI